MGSTLAVVFGFLLLYFTTALQIEAPCPYNCVCATTTIFCKSNLPSFLPNSTRIVNLQDIEYEIIDGDGVITKKSFRSLTLEYITDLVIEETSNVPIAYRPLKAIHNYTFNGLTNLKSLKIFCSALEKFQVMTFVGLSILEKLDLSYSGRIDIDGLIAALVGENVLPNLEFLDLSFCGYKTRLPLTKNILFGVFKPKPIKALNFSDVDITLADLGYFSEAFPKLEVLNISRIPLTRSLLLQQDLDINLVKVLPKLEILDFSYSKIPVLHRSVFRAGDYIKVDYMNHLQPIRNLYAKNVVPTNVRIVDSVMELRPNVTTNTELLNFENNGLVWLDLVFTGADIFTSLRYLYLGHNGMEYINPTIIHRCLNLKLLDLSKNELHVMVSNYPEFETLLRNNTRLENLNLSKNKLRFVPKYLLQNTNSLQVLILSENYLDVFSLEMNHLLHLSEIDLRSNKFTLLDGTFISALNSLYNSQNEFNTSNKSSLAVKLHGNPFICSCKTRETVNFLVNTKVHIEKKENVVCDLEGKKRLMNGETVLDTMYLCKRLMITLVSSISAAVAGLCICGASIGLIVWIRRRSRKRRMKAIIEKYRLEEENEKYLVFLGYCSEDVEFATYSVYIELERRLKALLQAENDVICIGDEHFTPGRPISENIVKHIASSRVVLLLISKDFCGSPWCEYETMVSYYDKKPIILMFKEHVPQNVLPSVLKKIYKRYARIIWKDKGNGQMEPVPKWEKICDTILELANF